MVLIGNSNVGGVVINRRSVKNFFEALIQTFSDKQGSKVDGPWSKDSDYN